MLLKARIWVKYNRFGGKSNAGRESRGAALVRVARRQATRAILFRRASASGRFGIPENRRFRLETGLRGLATHSLYSRPADPTLSATSRTVPTPTRALHPRRSCYGLDRSHAGPMGTQRSYRRCDLEPAFGSNGRTLHAHRFFRHFSQASPISERSRRGGVSNCSSKAATLGGLVPR